MLWLAVLTLPDGSRVESSLLAVQATDAGRARAYRLRLTNGSVREFSTLAAILQHLVDHYDPDDLSRAACTHEALTVDLAVAAGTDLPPGRDTRVTAAGSLERVPGREHP